MKLKHTRQIKLLSWITILMFLFSSLGGVFGTPPGSANVGPSGLNLPDVNPFAAGGNQPGLPNKRGSTVKQLPPPALASPTAKSTSAPRTSTTTPFTTVAPQITPFTAITPFSSDSLFNSTKPLDTATVSSNTYQPTEPEPVITNPPSNNVTNEPIPTTQIALSYWSIENEGRINSDNQYAFVIDACFSASSNITTIEYTYSLDGAAWQPLAINDDYGIWQSGGIWHHQVIADLSKLPERTYLLKATAVDDNKFSISSECQISKDITPPVKVSNFNAEPSSDNQKMLLSWSNPSEDFGYVSIEKFVPQNYENYALSLSEGQMPPGYWEVLDQTNANSYTDEDVDAFQTYYYRIKTFDPHGNQAAEIATVTAIMDATEIALLDWDLDSDGVVVLDNLTRFGINARFAALKPIASIDYKISFDGQNWQDLELIYDDGFYYDNYYKVGSRYVEINTSSIAVEQFWVQATAKDINGKTASATEVIRFASNATGLQITPNAANNALVLNWTNPNDTSYARVDLWVYDSGNSGSGYWDEVAYFYNGENTYTYNNATAYQNYTFRVVVRDQEWNYSPRPPAVTGCLNVTGPITVKEWYVENEGRIDAQQAAGYQVSAFFMAAKDITAIEYSYSTDGTNWNSLDPYISSQNENVLKSGGSWYRYITLNLTGPNGLADGTYQIRAIAVDADGYNFPTETTVAKDVTYPENVTNLTAEPNEEKTGFVLNWTNPPEDFSYVIIQRNSTYLSTNFTGSTFNDAVVTAGIPITYCITPVDDFGNRAQDPVELTVVRPVDAPVLYSLSPATGYSTRGESIYYSADFIDNKAITSIVFEVSPDGQNWQVLNANNSAPSPNSNNHYSLSGTWNIQTIGEADYQLRVTATDIDSRRTTSEPITISIDRVPPAKPANFTAVSVANGIKLSWSADNKVSYYYLYRYLNGAYSYDWYINPATDNKTDTYAQPGKMYVYKLIPYDNQGNVGPAAYVSGEFYTGPALSLVGGQSVGTADSAYTLRGTTEPGASVTVNGSAVTVDESGQFSYSITLGAEPVNLTVSAVNSAGTHTVVQNVTLDNKAPIVAYLNPGDRTLIKGSYQLSAKATDYTGSGVARIDFEVSTDDALTWHVIGSFSSEELYTDSSGYYEAGNYYRSWSADFRWDSTASIGEQGPLASRDYKFRAVVYDVAGNSSNGTPVRIWTIDNSAPAVPTGLTATAAMEQVTLTWSPSADTDLMTYYPYQIYRSTQPDTGFVRIGDTADTKCVDTTVKGGTTYYYVITAKDKAGNESTYSPVVSCLPLSDTTAPTITSVSPDDGSVVGGATVYVSVNATDNSSKSLSFDYEYSFDQGQTWKEMYGSEYGPYKSSYWYSTMYWQTAGLNSGECQIRITAVDNAGNKSAVIKSIQLDTVVSPVQNLRAVPAEGAVSLSWDAVADSDCGSYWIYRSNYLTGGFEKQAGVDKNTLSYRDTAVVLGKTYYYKIISLDNFGNKSAESAIVYSKPGDDMTKPVVTLITLTNPGEGQKAGGPTVNFYAQATDNKAVKEMDAFYSIDNGTTWVHMQLSKSGPYEQGYSPDYYYRTDFYWTTGSLASGNYRIKVTAKDAAGNEGSLEADWSLDKTVSAVTAASATGGDASIKLDWQLIADEDARGYLIARSSEPGGPYTIITRENYYGWYDLWLPSTQKTYTDTGLNPGTTYYYKIISGDMYNNRAESAVVSATTWVDELKPTIIRVEPANGTTIGGSSIKTLKVYFSDNYGYQGTSAKIEYCTPTSDWKPVAAQVSGPSRGYNDTDYNFSASWDLSVMPSGTYTVRYTVSDKAGNPSIETVNYQIDRTAPQAPGNLTATYGSGNVSLVWEAPINFDVHHYRIFRANALEGPYNLLAQVNGRAAVTYTDNTTAPGLTYYYKVTAVDNFSQEGEASNIAAAAAISDAVPPTILGLTPDSGAILGSQTTITVRAEDNLALSRITLQYSTDQGSSWIDINTIATRGEATFLWTTAPLNGNVQVRAVACDSAGNLSDGKPVRTYTIDNQGPAQVSGLKATAYPTYVVLQWQDVPDADFAFFQVERKDNLTGDYVFDQKVTNTLGCSIQNLKPNTDYWFRVTAYDTRGNRGTPSEELLVKTGVDVNAPVITDLRPLPGFFASEIPLAVTAEDNSSVAGVDIQFSRDKLTWSDLTSLRPTNVTAKVTVNYTWDVLGLTEGSIFVRARAVDSAGNVGQYTPPIEYRLDRTDPVQPSGLAVTASSGYITLSWLKNSEADIVGYNLYRSESETGQYNLISGKMLYLSYRDRDVLSGKTYYYKVAAVDAAGNVSALAGPVSAQLLADTEKPVVNSIAPRDGSTLPGNAKIYVLASDDYRVATVKLEYLEVGSGSNWTAIGSKPVNSYGEVITFDWQSSTLHDGLYQVRAIAVDQAGNQSDSLIVNYQLNADPPAKPVVTAKPGGWKVDLSWTSGNEPDLAGFRVFRGDIMGGPYTLLKQTTATSYADLNLTPNHRYYYMIQSVDKYGNSCDSTEVNAVPTSEDHQNPTAEAGDNLTATVGMEVGFDGTLSKDNDKIARYLWDFGDGTTAETAQPVHIFDHFGTYPVSLTVFDPAGNASTPDWLQVNVIPQQKAGTLEVRVLDDVSGVVLSGASVVVQYPDGTLEKTYTNGVGVANLTVLPGDYKVYAYKTDFKPGSTDAAVVVNQKTTATVRLKQGQLVVGELTVNRMTLDQILDAGIDVNAPENQWVYKFEIHLAFNDAPLDPQELIVNGSGEILGDGGGGGDGFGFSSGGEEMIAYPMVIPNKEHPEVRPTIAYLVIPGEARWLKEFFEVGLTLENTADPEFVLAGSTATLTLPDGLALAPTRDQQTLQVDLGEIAGGEKREVKWIIRGDKKGEYNLQAQFDGILQPFGDPVQTIFRTKEPFKVWGDDALQMHVEAQDEAWRGYPYHLRLGLENVSDVPVYNAAVELYDYGKQNYIYAPNQDLVQSIRELPPGETLWTDYWLISAVQDDLDLSSSYIVKTGGNAAIQTDINSFEVPIMFQPAPEGKCPVLRQSNGDFAVELNWDLVEGATGYRIYRVRDDLKVSTVSEMVYQTGPERCSINLMEPYGARDYVLMTLFGEREELRHAVTGLSWEHRAGQPVITVDPMTVRKDSSTELLITVNSAGFPVVDGTVDVGSFAQGVELDENGQAKISVTPSEEGSFTVTAYDKSGTAIAAATVTVLPALNEVPAIPQDLRLTAAGRQITLEWNANSESDLAGYNLYWLVNNSWKRLNTETVTETVYNLKGLNFGVPYVFAVTAVDQSGNESGMSVPKSATLFRVPSIITTTLGSAAAAGQPVDFRVSLDANSDVDELVRVRITLNDPQQAGLLDLKYLDSNDGSYHKLDFDANGTAWFGPLTGFPLADNTSDFRVAFSKSGVYGYRLETVACGNGSVLNSLSKVIEVKGAYTAPVLRDNLAAAIALGTETAFQITTKANSAEGTLVRLRVKLNNPAQSSAFVLQGKDNQGSFQPVSFDAQGTAWLGSAAGFLLADSAQEFRLSCTAQGNYGYKVELVDLESDVVLAVLNKTVLVKDDYVPAVITDNLPVAVDSAKQYSFSMSTQPNSELDTLVRVKLMLSNAAQAEHVKLEYKTADGSFCPLNFDEQGIAWYGAASGFQLKNQSTEFRIVFAQPGSYGYSWQIIEAAGTKTLAAKTKAVTVKGQARPAVISDNLTQTIIQGVEQSLLITTVANSDSCKLSRVKLSLANPTQASKINLQLQNADGSYSIVNISSQGEAWLDSGSAAALRDNQIRLKAVFTEAGSYRYRLELIEVSTAGILASTEKCIQVQSMYKAPIIKDTLPTNVLVGESCDFQISTTANSAVNKQVRVKIALSDPAQAGNVALQCRTVDGNYQALVFDQQGVTWIGSPAGFALKDESINLRAVFTQQGSYRYKLELVDTIGGQTLASAIKCVGVQGTYLPPVIESDLAASIKKGTEQNFQVQTTANSALNSMVRIKVILLNPALGNSVKLQYKDMNGIYQQLVFDSEGVTWFGPPNGFPLVDKISDMKVLFSAEGSYDYRLELVRSADNKVLATAEQSVTVYDSSVSDRPSVPPGGSSGGAQELIPVAAPLPAPGLLTDLTEDYWAYTEIEYLVNQKIITGYPDGTFQPGQHLTRAELAAIIVKALKLDVASDLQTTFRDVQAEHWAAQAISAIRAAGIMSGYGDGTFKPENLISREEMVQVLYNSWRYGDKANTGKDTASVLERFKDRNKLPAWSAQAAAEMVDNGLVQGINQEMFGAGKLSTREEAAVLVYRVLEKRGAAV